MERPGGLPGTIRALLAEGHFLPAGITLLLGLGLVGLGFSMPRQMGWATSPGLFPILIGGGLVLLAAALAFEGMRVRRAARPEGTGAGEAAPRRRLAPVLTFAIVVVYATVLLRLLPYEVATVFFLVAAMVANGVRSVKVIALASLGTTLVLSVIFILVLETLLPGTSSIVEDLFYR